MVSLIRNQVLKHLSKFTKNLSVENIQFSALKGRCELQNLELNEELLMELLELPCWLSLTRAFCNLAVLKVPWTKLKSEPIVITLDCVEIQVETCEQLRNIVPSTKPSYTSGRYGFAEQTLDSITIIVNSVNIHLKSLAFEATLEIQRLIVDSQTPNWQKGDLRQCRLKNRDTNELLLFKQIEWQTMRIEAKVSSKPATPLVALSPLRLLTSSARCRLTLKKRLADCSLVTSRLFVVFDQLLWVLTDAQMVAALHFANSLADLVEKATDLSHKLQASKHLSLPIDSSYGRSLSKKETPLTAIWRAYDIAETSYHVFCTAIDLHLVDETATGSVCRSGLPELEKGGCLQVTLKNLQIDHYPFHRACVGRDHWVRYQEPNGDRIPWLDEMHLNYAKKNNLTYAHNEYRLPLHLMCSTTLLIVDKFTVYKVSTSTRAERQPFLSTNNYKNPSEKAIFIDFTSSYYPGSSYDLAPPQPYCYVNLGPSNIRLDIATLLWGVAFMRSILRENLFVLNHETPITMCRVEIYLTKIMFDEVVAQCSRVICSNSREGISSSRAELKQALDSFSRGPLFFETNKYPWADGDFDTPPGPSAISHHIVDHCMSEDGTTEGVWSICVDPVWVDFVEKGHRPETILDPLPLTLWYCQKQILAHIRGLVNIQLCHNHFHKLMEKVKIVATLINQLNSDIRKSVTANGCHLDLMLSVMLPMVNVSLVLKANAGFNMATTKQDNFRSDDSARSESPPTISSIESIPAATELSRPELAGSTGPPSGSYTDSLSVSMSLCEDAVDALSVRSDESDSIAERLVGMLGDSSHARLGEELLAGIELAEEAAEEAHEANDDLDDQLSSADSDPSQLVSVVLLKVREIQLAAVNESLLYQMHSIEFEENSSVQRDVYQAEFSARTRTVATQNSLNKQMAATCLASGRLDLNEPQRLQLLLQGLELKLSSGSIAGLADMFRESLHAHKNNNNNNSHSHSHNNNSHNNNSHDSHNSHNNHNNNNNNNSYSNNNGGGSGGGSGGGGPSQSNGKSDPIESAFDDLPLSVRVLLYDIKVRTGPGQLLVVPHCLIERPWSVGNESSVYVLPIGFSTLDESVEKLLRNNISIDKLPVTSLNQVIRESSYMHHLATRIQLLENDNNSLKLESKQHKKDNEKLSAQNAKLRAEIERLQQEIAARIK